VEPLELRSRGGVTFVEALACVFHDLVPDPERDLVLGAQGDALHVDRRADPGAAGARRALRSQPEVM
jgi:hypothetical protein